MSCVCVRLRLCVFRICILYIESDGATEGDRQREREKGTAVKAEGCGMWFRLCAIRALPLELEEAKKESIFFLPLLQKRISCKKKNSGI